MVTDITQLRQSRLNRLELVLKRRLNGVQPGEFLGYGASEGLVVHNVRERLPEDSAARIHLPATMATGVEHVWESEPDYTLTAGVVVDLSPDMFYGTGHGEKIESAIDAAFASVWLTSHRGNRCGLVTVSGSHPDYLPHSQGTRHVQRCRTYLSASRTPDGTTTDLSAGLTRFQREFKQRGLCVVVSSFLRPGWEDKLIQIGRKHEVICFQVLDRREFQVEDIGLVDFVDPITQESILVDTSDSEWRNRFAQAAASQQADIHRRIVQSGAQHEVLWTDQDWTESICRFFSRKRLRGGRGR